MIFNPRLWMAMGGGGDGPPPDVVAPALAWTITANGLRANGVAAESLNPAITLDSADFVFAADTGSVPAISSIGYATTTLDDDTVQVDFATPFYAVQTVTVEIPAGAVEDLAGNGLEAVVDGEVANLSTVEPVEAIAETGFSTASTGTYLGRSDSGAALPAATEQTVRVYARLKSTATLNTIQRLFSKGNGNPGWTIAVTSTAGLQYRDSRNHFNGDYIFSDADKGKTFLFIATRSAAGGCQFYVYHAGLESVVLVDSSTNGLAPNTTTSSVAIGAERGDGVGGNECSDWEIIACAYGNQYLDFAAAKAEALATVAAGTIPTDIVGAVSVYQAPDLAVDLVGSNHLTRVTAGGAFSTVTFEPEYQDSGYFPWILNGGQSNNRGSAMLSAVPDYSGTGGINYTLNYPEVRLWCNQEPTARNWGELRPLGDDLWGPPLSLGRAAIANGLLPETHNGKPVSETLYILDHAIGSSSLAAEWSVSDPENLGSVVTNLISIYEQAMLTVAGPNRHFDLFATPVCIGVSFNQQEADATNEVDSLAHGGRMVELHTWFRANYECTADFRWVSYHPPPWQTTTWKANISPGLLAAQTTINTAAGRSEFVLIDTTNSVHDGDELHYDAGTLIQSGISAEAALRTGSDQVMAAPI